MISDADDADIRALLRSRPMDGAIRVALTREPDSRLAAALEGDRHFTCVVRGRDGQLLGFGSRSVRRVYLNGQPALVGYLGQLRAASGATSLRRLAGGFARMQDARQPDEAPFDVTAILLDNAPARRLLERGLPGLPRYRLLCEVETLVLPTARPKSGAPVRRARPEDRENLLAFLRRELAPRPFAPVWEAVELDFFLLEKEGELLAAGALWDQRACKQTVIAGYAPWLQLSRPLVNLGLRLAGQPALPPPGSVLAMAFLAAFTVRSDDPDLAFPLVAAILREARSRGLEQLVLSLAREHPLREPLRRRFAARPYRSGLYTVTWPGEVEPENLLGGVPYVEAAFL